MPRPLSPAAVHVLKAIVAGQRFGFDIMDATGLPSGTVYPILSRLEKTGLVRATWESATLARRELRPRRRYYELSAKGTRELAVAVEHYRALGVMTGATPRPEPQRG